MLLNCDIGKESRVPWTAGRSHQSILNEFNPEYSLKALMLKLQYFGHLMRTADTGKILIWERSKAEGEEGDRGGDDWMTSLVQWTYTWGNSRW